MYHFDSFDEAYSYLIANGGYDSDEYLRQKPDESGYKYESRILSIANRIYDCMKNYPREIYAYVKANPNLPQYTFAELTSLSYKELSSLRNSLGIKKQRKKGKKVISQEVAGVQYQEAMKIIQDTPVREVAAIAIQSNVEDDRDLFDEAILTEDELRTMYGEDMPSVRELGLMGIVPEYPDEYDRRLKLSFDEAIRKTPKPKDKLKSSRDF